MTKYDLFVLYGKVQQKDKQAENMLVSEHKKKYPRSDMHNGYNGRGTEHYRENLHAMYLHLTK